MTHIAFPTSTDAAPAVADLVNEVYEAAEKGLWVEGSQRTTAAEVAELIEAGEIAVARRGEEIVGSVRIQRLGERLGEFGMLAASPEARGEGIGRDLVRFAEEHCRHTGCDVMRLELLVPRDWTHPVKQFLHDWYTRIGYRRVRVGSIEEQYPDLAPRLATPCGFAIYHKNLDVEAGEQLRGVAGQDAAE